MIYLDHNATTPVDGRVLAAMLPYFAEHPGNPSSLHWAGKAAREAVEQARGKVAAALGAAPEGILFTSGGTEAIATGIRTAVGCQPEKPYVLISSIEHSATWKSAMASVGAERMLVVPVDAEGAYDLDVLSDHLRRHGGKIALACMMWANNESGGLPGIQRAAEIVAGEGVPVFCDAVQALGKVPVELAAVPVDFLALAGHKIHAPKGIGALWVRPGMPLHPMFVGGGQENGRRAGTENVPAIVGLGEAAEVAVARLEGGEVAAMQIRRDRLETGVMERIPGVHRVGSRDARTPNTSCLRFEGAPAAAMLVVLDDLGLACSAGSACASKSNEPSRVLMAHGLTADQAMQALRFSLATMTTDAEIHRAISLIETAAHRVRAACAPVGSVVRNT